MMNGKRRMIALTVAALSLALGAIGCGTVSRTSSAEPSGFLGDYSLLAPGEGDQAQLIYINPTTDFARYQRVILDPVSIWFDEGSDLMDVPREDLEHLASYMYQAIRRELQKDYALTTKPGPGVMRIRLAITEAIGSKIVADIITTVVPFGRALSEGKNLVTGTQSFVGKAGLEAEFIDTQTGLRIAAAVDERAGGKSVRGSTRTWGDVEAALDLWAERTRLRLERQRAGLR